jgi:hypothetical protein
MIAFILKLIGTFLFLNFIVYAATEFIEDHGETGLSVFGEKIHKVSSLIAKWTMMAAIALVVLGFILSIIMFIWSL